MLVTKNTSELPLVEDTIDTTRHDAEEQIPVAESALEELACHRAYQARSHSHAVQELVLQLWQVAVRTILTARPAVTLALRASSVASSHESRALRTLDGPYSASSTKRVRRWQPLSV